jgi:hypothetical protein
MDDLVFPKSMKASLTQQGSRNSRRALEFKLYESLRLSVIMRRGERTRSGEGGKTQPQKDLLNATSLS